MISDVHNALHVEILCKLTGTNQYVESEEPSVLIKPVWDNNSYQSFNDSLNLETIVNLNVKLNIVDVTTVNKDTINNLIEECNDIIIQAASASGMLKENKLSKNNCIRNNIKCKVKKTCFNHECYEKRKDYRKAKNYNWRVKTADSKNNLIRCSKAYKKVLNFQYNEYRKNFIKKLRNLSHNDPKSYWSLINRSSNCNTKQNVLDKVSLECFHDHFKKLSNVQDGAEGDFTETIDRNVITNLNTQLNTTITEKEIVKAIKLLKNNKSCGTDFILNEFLKNSCQKMLPIFVKLFNK